MHPPFDRRSGSHGEDGLIAAHWPSDVLLHPELCAVDVETTLCNAPATISSTLFDEKKAFIYQWHAWLPQSTAAFVVQPGGSEVSEPLYLAAAHSV